MLVFPSSQEHRESLTYTFLHIPVSLSFYTSPLQPLGHCHPQKSWLNMDKNLISRLCVCLFFKQYFAFKEVCIWNAGAKLSNPCLRGGISSAPEFPFSLHSQLERLWSVSWSQVPPPKTNAQYFSSPIFSSPYQIGMGTRIHKMKTNIFKWLLQEEVGLNRLLTMCKYG